jgi:hypothetical protein
MIAAGGSCDTRRLCRFVADQRVEGTARLEHAGQLQVLKFERDRLFDAGQAHIHDRCAAQPRRNAVMGGRDIVSRCHGVSGDVWFGVRR